MQPVPAHMPSGKIRNGNTMDNDKLKLVSATYESEDNVYRYTETRNKDGNIEKRWFKNIRADSAWQNWDKWCKHRTDGPAYIDGNGLERYYQLDVLHRTDGPASYHVRGKLKGVPMYRLKGVKVSVYKVLGDTPESLAHALKYESGGKKT